MEINSRLYFIGNIGNGKYHHAAMKHPFERTIHTLCLPNVPIMCYWDCEAKKEGDGYEAGVDDAEQWDEYFADVTCPTCLKRARGKDSGNQNKLF